VNYPRVIHRVSGRLSGMWEVWSNPPWPGYVCHTSCLHCVDN